MDREPKGGMSRSATAETRTKRRRLRGIAARHLRLKLPLVALALLTFQPCSALACSIAEDSRPVEVQIDEWVRESYLTAQAMVEVVALEGSRRNRPGLVRVVRVLKGPIRRGQLLSLRSVEESMCGAGDFETGSRGLILIERVRHRMEFQGYLRPDYLQRLGRLGLRPLNAPAPRR
jgi:hypothetical protein